MRCINIQNSIANAISRFSARVDEMLVTLDTLLLWHLQPCVQPAFAGAVSAAPVSTGHLGTMCLFRDLGTANLPTQRMGNYLPAISEPAGKLGTVALKRLLQRLS